MDATQAIHTYLATAPESQFAGQSVDVQAHWQGVDNLLWRVVCEGREAVLKLFIDAGQVRSRRQYDGQQLFYPAGFACRPLWYDWQPAGLARPVLVYEWADGNPLDSAGSFGLRETARILAHIHAVGIEDVGRLSPNPVSLDYFWRLLANSIGNIDDWLGQAEAQALHTDFLRLAHAAQGLAEEALPSSMGVAPTAIHGDPRLDNFVDAGGAVMLLDWERFGLGDRALEAANFLFLAQPNLDDQQQADWLETYLAYADQPGLDLRIDIYRRLLPFQSVCYLLDGLRELSADADLFAQHQDDLPFLQATLVASIVQASAQLGIKHSEIEYGEIETSVARLFAAL